MRLDRLREGLLGGPLLPGGVHDARPLPHTVGPEAPNVREAIGTMPARSDLAMIQEASPSPQYNSGISTTLAMGKLAGALRGDVPQRQVAPTPQFKVGLGQLSDLVQGKGMGRMVPAEPPIDVAMGPVDEGDDLPRRPPPNLPDKPPLSPEDQKAVDEAQDGLLRGGPLQNMTPVDPSYGDLFKKLRPYQ